MGYHISFSLIAWLIERYMSTVLECFELSTVVHSLLIDYVLLIGHNRSISISNIII